MQADSNDDLDRTDELPRLDIATYEANLAAGGTDPLANTDTWAVEALRGFDLSDDHEPEPESSTRSRVPKQVIAGSADLSINVDRLHKRISELEAGSAAARTANGELERRYLSMDSDRAELEQRLSALQAQNAKLIEDSAASHERAQRLEQQLRDQFAQHNTWLNDAAATREADRLNAEQTRTALEVELVRNAAQMAELQAGQARLQTEMAEIAALAASRAAEISQLQQSLTEEEDTVHSLGRNLAAKLADYEIVSSLVAQRNTTIKSLERTRDELTRDLQQAMENSSSLAAQLADAGQRVAQDSARFGELDHELGTRDQQLSQLNAQIARLTADLQAMSLERDSGLAALSQEQQLQERTQQTLAERMHEVAALRGSLQASEAQVTALQAGLQTTAATREQLVTTAAELERTSAELASTRGEAAQIWTELETQSAAAHAREEELTAARQTVAELQSARDELQRALESANGKIEKLYAVSRDDTEFLTAKTTELAALKRQFEEQVPAIRSLEQSIHARDTLIEDLRNEVRTVQEERAIMAGQLDKARLRMKSLAQQIFHKDSRIATLKADLAVHTEALAAIRRDVNRVEGDPEDLAEDHSERVLEPVGQEGEAIALNRKVMTIGRTNDNDIFIPSKMISRHHARLLVGPNAVIVEDAGSTNGCFVNNQQIKQHVLREGDILAIGDLKFRLAIRPAADPRARANVISFNEGRRNNE